MQNRDDYLKTIGIQQWQRRDQVVQDIDWHCQGPINTARFAFIWEQTPSVLLDWTQPELQLLEKIIQSLDITVDQALLIWPLQNPIQTSIPRLSSFCCGVIFGQTLIRHLKHPKKITTLALPQLMQDADAKRKLWQALKAAKDHA